MMSEYYQVRTKDGMFLSIGKYISCAAAMGLDEGGNFPWSRHSIKTLPLP